MSIRVKLEAAKRKLHERYQQAENGKLRMMVFMMMMIMMVVVVVFMMMQQRSRGRYR